MLRAGRLKLTLNETSEGIVIEDAVPVTDEEGLSGREYTFTLSNTGTKSNYTIYLDDVLDIDADGTNDFEESERLSDSVIKYSLVKNGTITTQLLTEIGTNPERVLDSGTINNGQTNTYSLRIWISEDAENDSILNKVFAAKLRIEAEQAPRTVSYEPKYFAFGEPTTTSATNYTTLGKNIFVGLDNAGTQKSVCLVKDGSLKCFKNNNATKEQANLKTLFGEEKCSSDSSSVTCDDGTYSCSANIDGSVNCHEDSTTVACTISSTGSVTCTE